MSRNIVKVYIFRFFKKIQEAETQKIFRNFLYNVGNKINVVCVPLGQLNINDENLKKLGEQLYENGKCRLVGTRIGETVSFKVEKNKVEELQQKIDELRFKDISEHITIWAIDYPSSNITVNYKDNSSHRVVKSAGFNGGNGEQWEHDNYSELSKEIWSLVPKEKQNKFEAKVKKPIVTVKLIICIVLGVGIVVLISAIFIFKKRKVK